MGSDFLSCKSPNLYNHVQTIGSYSTTSCSFKYSITSLTHLLMLRRPVFRRISGSSGGS